MVQDSLASSDGELVADGGSHVSLCAFRRIGERTAEREIGRHRCGERTSRSVRPWCLDPRRVKFEEMVSVEQHVDDFRPVAGGRWPVFGGR